MGKLKLTELNSFVILSNYEYKIDYNNFNPQ